jgi:branched-chain amino acid transport system ATP-binding protein
MLEVSGLSKRFGQFPAVTAVSFSLRQGEILGLIGPNGSGKSTTFNLIAGAMRPSSGSIRFEGKEIGGLPAHKVCRMGLARTFQIPRPFRRLSLVENVMLAANYGCTSTVGKDEANRRAQGALEMVGLPAHGGTEGLGAAALKKLELARALATGPRLLLADESLGGLDHAEMEHAALMLETIRTKLGITIIWVEHIMGLLMRIVDRVIVLDHGEKIFEGLPEAAAKDARVTEVYLGHARA